MSLLEETKSLLRRYRIVPNKLKGQNFTVDPLLFERVSEYASPIKSDVALDVGAGFGFLTRLLSEKCKCVLAIESDRRLVEALHSRFQGSSNVQIIEGDILKVHVPVFCKMVSIPPYGISSRFLVWLFDKCFACAVLVLQREFANRLIAGVGTENYGWLSVFTHYYADSELLDEVPKSSFYPQPEVDSIIVRLKRRESPPFQVKNEIVFRHMVRSLFTQRNRKVRNAILAFAKGRSSVEKKEVDKLLERIPFGNVRVEELAPEDFGVLANAYSN